MISPMGLYGASSDSPEFRAQSIKGVMRFWWRAGLQATNLEKMCRQEEELFGYSRQEEGTGGRAPFSISVQSDSDKVKRKKSPFLPNHQKGKLCMSMCSFQPESKFIVTIRARSKECLNRAQSVFELTALLGGLGRRVRRGFGSFVISQLPEPKSLEEDALRTLILNKLMDVYGSGSYVTTSHDVIVPKKPPASFQYPNILSIRIKATSKTSEDVLKNIHKVSHEFSVPQHRSKLVGGSGRHASPVCLSLYELRRSKNQLFVVAVLLNSSSRNNVSYKKNQDSFIDKVIASV